MATYRLEAKVISRAKGRSATASAAYRAGAAIEDERSGLLFDYTRKRGVLHSEIIAPANTPEWMLDRSALWNAVERVEQRRDAQLARDFIISLPYELTHYQRIELMRDFLAQEFVTRGMIADFSIHAPDRRSDDRNHHSHVMVTMRELTSAGFGLKNREWNRTELLEQWRKRWADTVNLYLERHGHEAHVDHRSLQDQGIDREPEPKKGPVATEMERNGRASHAGDDVRAVKARNDEREALARAADEIDAELIMLDSERPRGSAFEDVREALEPDDAAHPTRPGYNDSNAGMVAQQADAMRRFRRNSDALKARRELRSDDAPPLSSLLDGDGIIPKVSEGKGESSSMVSKYDHLRAEQSQATPEPELSQQPEPSQPEISEPAQPRAANVNWPMDQSMAAQNAAANVWAKAGHENRQDQAREAPDQPSGQDGPPESEQDDKQQDRKLNFAADREGAARERGSLKREQSDAEPSKDVGSDRKLNFARDRGQNPELDR